MGADLNQHVAVALRRVELIDGERRHLHELTRALSRESIAPIEQGGAKADRDRQTVGRRRCSTWKVCTKPFRSNDLVAMLQGVLAAAVH